MLKAVDSSNESTAESLFKRRIRRDSIQSTDIPTKLLEFLSSPEHSRALPGHETVSVAYGVRKPKFLLKKSKLELLGIFKKENPEVNFSSRVLLREWPAHFVPASHKDQERNVCPLHSNLRRCLDGLRKAGAAQNLPTVQQLTPWIPQPGQRSVLWANATIVLSSLLIFLQILM